MRVPTLYISTWGALRVTVVHQRCPPDRSGYCQSAETPHMAGRALTAVALLIVAALIVGAVYAVSIDRAVNGNLQHNSDQLPAETPTAKGRRPAPQSAQVLLSTTC